MLTENLARVTNTIRAADPSRAVRLVAVSKTKPVADLKQAYDAGQRHFGENYVNEVIEKAPHLPDDICWHFIGHLQSNKCKKLLEVPNLWAIETVDSLKLANLLNANSAHRSEPLRIYLQVNTSGEDNKNGIEPKDTVAVAKHVTSENKNLLLQGLMTIGALGASDNNEQYNPDFERLVMCRKTLEAELGLQNLELSMGMSADYEVAVKMGSDNVRVGSAIFGERQRKN